MWKGFVKGCKKVGSAIARHSPTILTVGSVAGIFVTSYESGRAAIEAEHIIERLRKQYGDDIPTKVLVKEVGPVFIKPGAFAIATAGMMVGGNMISQNRIKTLSGFITASGLTASEFKDKLTNLIGTEKVKEVQSAVNQDQMEKDISKKEKGNADPKKPEIEVLPEAPEGKTIFYDTLTKQFFVSTINDVMNAACRLNSHLNGMDNFVPVADWLSELEVGNTDYPWARHLGWTFDNPIRISTSWVHWKGERITAIDYQGYLVPYYGKRVALER